MSNMTFKDTLIMAGIAVFLITITAIGMGYGINILLEDDEYIIEHLCTHGCTVSVYEDYENHEPCFDNNYCDDYAPCISNPGVKIVNVSISEVNCQ